MKALRSKAVMLIALAVCMVCFLCACDSTHTHTPGEWITDDAPTCTVKGTRHNECAVCGEVVKLEQIPAKGHDYEDGVCTVCGIEDPDYIDSEDDPDVCEHDLIHHEAKEPTCTEIGWDAYDKCLKCGYTTYSEKAALGHNYEGDVCTECGELKPSEGLAFTSNGDDTCYVSGIGSYTDTEIIIPKLSPEGQKVTGIGYMAFDNCTRLTSITIPDSVTSIGVSAFSGCSNLTSVIIPNSITNIGGSAFWDCDSLASITIPDSVISISESAFRKCNSLSRIIVGTNNTAYKSIDGNLYTKDGKVLIQYAIGKDEATFAIPEDVTIIGSWAFFESNNLASVIIPDSVKNVYDYAFRGCTSLTSITVADGVSSIGEGAFYECESLTEVIIGRALTSIDKYVFYECSNLTSITVSDNNTAYKSIDGNLYTKDGKVLVQYAVGKTETLFVIPENVTSIGEGAFYECSSLASITIPKGLTKIGENAFYSCDSISFIIYKGTAEEYAQIEIDNGNTHFTSITPAFSNGNEIGYLCPEYDVPLFDENGNTGEKFNPAANTGKVTVINFWGAWCPPCRAELPAFDMIASEYKEQVTVIAVHTFYLSESATQYVKDNFPDSDILFGLDKPYEGYDDDYYFTTLGGAGFYPFTVILDKNGVIVHTVTGMLHYDDELVDDGGVLLIRKGLKSIVEEALAK